MRFLDVRTDFAFKKVFDSEESKPLLIDFLNAVLEYPPERAIQELTIVDPYPIPLIKGMKDTYVDVKARLADGRRVIIEMQVLNVQGFEQRILYNAAKAYSLQLQKGEDYGLLNPVIALTLTDFILFDTTELTSRFKLLEKKQLIEYGDDIELIFIELPKFTLNESDLETARDRWLYFVKHAGSLEFIPDSLAREPHIHQAFDIANLAGMSEAELEAQEKRFDFIRLQRGSIDKARQEGREEGREEGLQQGEALLLKRLLRKRFGELSGDVERRLDQAGSGELETWTDRVLDAGSLEELFH
ncbi:MAG: Rpn family recombination-promoting nuclease/putative transposase [Methylococcaceae bacterium]|nr:Rpn family recombination-promoting nuclease/putative transposase [Methylococcaceae bacterium]